MCNGIINFVSPSMQTLHFILWSVACFWWRYFRTDTQISTQIHLQYSLLLPSSSSVLRTELWVIKCSLSQLSPSPSPFSLSLSLSPSIPPPLSPTSLSILTYKMARLKLFNAGFQSEASIGISTVFVCHLPPSPGSVSGVSLSSSLLEMGYGYVNENKLL